MLAKAASGSRFLEVPSAVKAKGHNKSTRDIEHTGLSHPPFLFYSYAEAPFAIKTAPNVQASQFEGNLDQYQGSKNDLGNVISDERLVMLVFKLEKEKLIKDTIIPLFSKSLKRMRQLSCCPNPADTALKAQQAETKEI